MPALCDSTSPKTLVIHTNQTGEIAKKDLEPARRLAREVDLSENPINALVSVLMLREGWDVQNVTVVVGLRPYNARANILPEQTIGRGLRLMFRDVPVNYRERVDIIGNKAFLHFVEDLEKLEDLMLDTFDIGKDKLRIITIAPETNRTAYDIGLPLLTTTLVRKKSLIEEIANLKVTGFSCPTLPLRPGDPAEETFRYEGFDILTLQRRLSVITPFPNPKRRRKSSAIMPVASRRL